MKADIEFQWEHEQENSFMTIQKLCCTPSILALYNVQKTVVIECDASKDGLGASHAKEKTCLRYPEW